MSKYVTLHGFGIPSGNNESSGNGVELNFEVVGGTSAPENPTENTIWVDTNIEITGYTLSSNERTEESVSNGFIVIKYDPYYQNGNGGFNAIINNNEIFIKPISAMQYISETDTWEQKTIKVWQNNQWVEVTTVPEFEYDGTYDLSVDGDNWKIKFLDSGTLTFKALNSAKNGVEAFLVGGGGSGASSNGTGGAGGGGGYTTTTELILNTGIEYLISIGGSNGTTSAFGISAANGSAGSGASGGAGTGKGGSGGSVGPTIGSGSEVYVGQGGAGGAGGAGVYAFNDTTDIQYGGGGGGGGGTSNGTGGAGGASGGGRGGNESSGTAGTANTGGGGGGGGGWYKGGAAGGSGIVIIRNKRG